jgi:hypothetical protein
MLRYTIIMADTTKQPAKKVPPKPKAVNATTKKAVKKTTIPEVQRMKKGRRATKAQHDTIVAEVGKLISELHTRRYIFQYMAQRWGLSQDMAAKYITEANKLFKNELPDAQRAVADLLEKLLDAEKKYRGKGMPHLMALKQIKELISPSRVQIGGDPQGIPIKTEHKSIVISPEQIQEALTAFEKQQNNDT